MKKLLIALGAFCAALSLFPLVSFAVAAFPYATGGTGTTTPNVGQVVYFGRTFMSGTPTTSATCSGGTTCTGFVVLGSSPITISSTAISVPVSIANGGTATSTFYDGGVVFYNGALGTLSQGTAQKDFFFDVANKRIGIGTASPIVPLQISTSTSGTGLFLRNILTAVGSFIDIDLGSSITSLVQGKIRATRTNSPSAGDGQLDFYTLQNGTTVQGLTIASTTVTASSTGAITYGGVISPLRGFVLSTATTTTWTASTTNSAYTPMMTMPFTGILRNVICSATSTQAFLGINIFINSTAVAPSYFVASSSEGTIAFTGANTFVPGDVIGMNVGTSTTDTNAKSVSCTLQATQTS